MRRFCLAHLGWFGPLCLVLVSAYVLFDLLDVDGSDVKQPAAVDTTAEEILAAGDEAHLLAITTPGTTPAPSHTVFSLLATSAGGAHPVSLRRLCSLMFRPRRTLQHRSLTPSHGTDPATRAA